MTQHRMLTFHCVLVPSCVLCHSRAVTCLYFTVWLKYKELHVFVICEEWLYVDLTLKNRQFNKCLLPVHIWSTRWFAQLSHLYKTSMLSMYFREDQPLCKSCFCVWNSIIFSSIVKQYRNTKKSKQNVIFMQNGWNEAIFD